MNKLIIKEVIEHDFTPKSFPSYRKETSHDIYYCIMPDVIIKVYRSGYTGYTSLVLGTYNTLGSDCVGKDTIECDGTEFHMAYLKAINAIDDAIYNHKPVSNTSEGDE